MSLGIQGIPPYLGGGPWDLKSPLKPGRFPWGLRDLQNLRGVHSTGQVSQTLGKSPKAWWQCLGLEGSPKPWEDSMGLEGSQKALGMSLGREGPSKPLSLNLVSLGVTSQVCAWLTPMRSR